MYVYDLVVLYVVVESDDDGCVVEVGTSASKQQFKTNN